MKEKNLTREQLLRELAELRQRITQLERSEVDHKQAEMLLREKEELQDTILRNVGAYIYLKDTQYRYTYVNKKVCDLFGFKEDEIIGKDDASFFSATSVEEIMRSDRRVIEGGETIRREEADLIALDNVPRTYWVVKLQLTDSFGNISGLCGISTDITDHKRAEEDLKIHEGDLRTILDSVNDAVFIHTSNGKIIDVNEKMLDIYKVSREEALSMTIADDFSALDDPRDTVPELCKSALRGEEKLFEWKARRPKDNSIFPVEVFLRKIRHNNADAILATVRDITDRKRAEEALRESEERFRGIANNLPGIVYQFYARDNGEWGMYFVDERAEDVYGLKVDPIEDWYERFYACIAPEDKERWLSYSEERVRSGSPWDIEVRFIRPTGAGGEMYIKALSQPKRLTNEVVYNGILLDITARKRAEKALQEAHDKLELRVVERTAELQRAYSILSENERLYRNLFDNASIGMFQSRLDGSGFLRINKAYASMLAYASPEEVMSTITDASTQIHTDPESRRELLAGLEQNDWYYSDQTYFRKDGSIMIGRTSVRKVLNPDGTPAYLEGIVEDITERRRAEKALQESEEKYRSAVESSFVGLSIVQDQILRFVNRGFCEITGYTYDELVDRVNPLEVIYSGDRKAIDLAIRKGLTSEAGNVEFGCRIVRKNGQVGYVKVFGTSLMYNGRRATASTMIDVTREKDLEQQLLRTQKLEAIGTLAGGVAHDFNNILAGIIGFAEMVQDDMAPESRAYHRLGLVLKGAHRGRDLVKQILTFSRHAEHEQKPFALSEIVEEGLKLVRPLLPATTQVRYKGLTSDDIILADSAQIHQVLMNLCTNSAYAIGRKGGELEISVTRDHFKKSDYMPSPGMKPGEYVTLTVRDTGPGMKPEILERIFDPFFTTKTHGEGTGLGLSVVHGIVKSHGGFIKVESEPGKGSIFSVYLPKLKRQEVLPTPEDLPVTGGKECILFVDDEDLLVELNNERLTKFGYDVVATTSSLEALEIFKKEPQRFHLVITDYTMPDMTGVDLARKLLKVRGDMPIILCTGYNDDISPDKAKKAGIREFLLKPQGKHDLDMAIRRVLDVKT